MDFGAHETAIPLTNHVTNERAIILELYYIEAILSNPRLLDLHRGLQRQRGSHAAFRDLPTMESYHWTSSETRELPSSKTAGKDGNKTLIPLNYTDALISYKPRKPSCFYRFSPRRGQTSPKTRSSS